MPSADGSYPPRRFGVEFKVSLLRVIATDRGPITAEAIVMSRRRVGTAEGRVTDGKGRLLAHGTTTCLIFQSKWCAERAFSAMGAPRLSYMCRGDSDPDKAQGFSGRRRRSGGGHVERGNSEIPLCPGLPVS